MFVLDTSVLLRLIKRDDLSQYELAKLTIGVEKIWISVTVLLETEWVLRSRYSYSREELLPVLDGLLDSFEVQLEDENACRVAIHWYRLGSDFADALHLARTQFTGTLLTFDRAFCKPARRSGVDFKVLRVPRRNPV